MPTHLPLAPPDLWGIRTESTQCQTTHSPRERCGSSGGAVPMGVTQTVPQLTGTSSPSHLWAPRTPQGQQCPKGFDNWFYGLEHCVSWLRAPWHSNPTLLVSEECCFGDGNLALTKLCGLSRFPLPTGVVRGCPPNCVFLAT